MSKKSKKKQVKTSKKVVNKVATPAEEKVTEVTENEVTESTEVEELDSNSAKKENKEDSAKSKRKENAKKDSKKEPKKADDKGKKNWFKGFKAELKKVIWPSKKDLFENTAVVIIVVAIVSILIFALDFIFSALTEFEVKQLEKIKNDTTNSIVENAIDENIVDNTTTGENNEVGIDLTNTTQE